MVAVYCDMVWSGVAGYDIAWHDMAWCVVACYDGLWYVMKRYSMLCCVM